MTLPNIDKVRRIDDSGRIRRDALEDVREEAETYREAATAWDELANAAESLGDAFDDWDRAEGRDDKADARDRLLEAVGEYVAAYDTVDLLDLDLDDDEVEP